MNLKKILIGAAFVFGLAVGSYFYSEKGITYPTTPSSMAKTSVMITNIAENHGGSGVILSSSKDESVILTNSHVCGVAEQGGLVKTDDSSHVVTSYRRSKVADLCLITVNADLGINTRIASKAPPMYSKAFASGHPSLLPNVVTEGHFSQHRVIEVMTGFRACTDADKTGDNILLCMLLGGIPQFNRYEAQLVTSLIKPGSSGSAVFNEDGEIAALVFAGSGEIGYGFTMPFEAISNFVEKEAPKTERQIPNNSSELNLNIEKAKNSCEDLIFDEPNAVKAIYGGTDSQVKTFINTMEKLCDTFEKDMVDYNGTVD